MCVLVVPFSRSLILKNEVTTFLEIVIEILFAIVGVSNVHLLFDVYSQCLCVLLGEYDLCLITVVISKVVAQNIVSVVVCMGCP